MASTPKRTFITSSLLAAAVALTACLAPTSEDAVYTQFYSEAGSLIDAGDFGNSTLNNRLVMT